MYLRNTDASAFIITWGGICALLTDFKLPYHVRFGSEGGVRHVRDRPGADLADAKILGRLVPPSGNKASSTAVFTDDPFAPRQ